MTDYVVITLPKATPANGTMAAPSQLSIDKVRASSANAAIRAVAEKKGDGQYVAVPARSWKPVTVKVEQTTKVSFGSGT